MFFIGDRALGKHSKVLIRHSSKALGPMPGLALVDSCFGKNGRGGKTLLQLQIIRQEGERADRQLKVYKVTVFPKAKKVTESEPHLPFDMTEGEWVTTLVRGKELGEDLVQVWRVHPQSLSMRRYFQSQSSEYQVPKELHAELGLGKQESGIWRLV